MVYAAKHAADGPRATASAAKYQLAALGGALVFTLANLLALGAPCTGPEVDLHSLPLLSLRRLHRHREHKRLFVLSLFSKLVILPT